MSAQPHPLAPAALARRAWPNGVRVLEDFGTTAVMVIAPLLLIVFIAGDVWDWHRVARTPVDFHIFWTAGHHYLQQDSPYGHSVSEAFVYPPPPALLFAPLALLPYHVAAGLFSLSLSRLLWVLCGPSAFGIGVSTRPRSSLRPC